MLREILGHPLREGRDQNPLPGGGIFPDLPEKIVHLRPRGANLDLGVDEPRGADDLLHHRSAAHPQFVLRRSRRYEDHLPHAVVELLEPERPVVECGGEPEPEIHQRLFPGPVAVVHPVQLGNGHVGLVEEGDEPLREVVEERIRRLPGSTPVEMAGVVLDAGTESHLGDHLEVVGGPLLQPLRLERLSLRVKFREPSFELLPDPVDRPLELILRRDVVAGREDDRFPSAP